MNHIVKAAVTILREDITLKKVVWLHQRQHKRWKLMQTRKCTFLASTTLEAMSLDICQVCLGCFAGCGVEAASATRH